MQGTRDGVTAIQMDIKIAGVTSEIMKRSTLQKQIVHVARILDTMTAAIPASRKDLSEYAPRNYRYKDR